MPLWSDTTKFAVVAAIGCVFLSAQIWLTWTGAKLVDPQIPVRWGFLKDVIDPVVVLLFVWGGWPAFAIALACAVVNQKLVHASLLLLTAAVAHGVLHTVHSFDIVTIWRVGTGVLTFLLIYAASLVVSLPLIWSFAIARRKSLCQRQE